ncbi:hypothetical protein C0J52_27549 [Blattella germanica]|nr:hypothetical protein C0J52_27549 [Blattella germanica]
MSPKKSVKRWIRTRSGAYSILITAAILLLVKTGPGRMHLYFHPYDSDFFDIVKGSIFEGFDNVTGTANGSYIVPNYVHFLFFGKPRISYAHAVCVLAAFKNQKPEKIFFHTDNKQFVGPHWEKIRDTLGNVLHIVDAKLPTEIFGQEFVFPYSVWHAGDVTRIRILMKYGGIFLDNDSYIVKSLDVFRRYEMTIGVTGGDFLGTMVLIAHKEARFLKLWLESYRGDYQPYSWYWNAGQKPMRDIIYAKPELVHKVENLLGLHGLADKLYIWNKWDNWRKYYSIHLIIRHRHYMDTLWNYIKWPTIDENNICDYPKPFGEMAREVYSDFCPKKRFIKSIIYSASVEYI